MDLKNLMSGIGVVIDDALYESNKKKTDGIFQIMERIEKDWEIPLVITDRIPSHDVCQNLLQSASFILLDWKLWSNDGELKRSGIEENVKFLEFAKEYFVPVFIFTNENILDVTEELPTSLYYQENPEKNFIFIKNKLDVIKEDEFDSLKNWIRTNASIYTLKAWEQEFYKAKRMLFGSMYSKSPDWPKIFWKSYKEDAADPSSSVTHLINDNLLGRFKSDIFDKQILDSNFTDAIDKETKREDIRSLISESCFIGKENLAENEIRSGDLFKLSGTKYLINIRPDCDCVPREKNGNRGKIDDMKLYCLTGKQRTDEQLKRRFSKNQNKRNIETVYENISYYIFNGATIIFDFKNLEIKKYLDVKDHFVGRLIPPYITRIQQRYAFYLQRQGLPCVPEEAFPDFAIVEPREQGGKLELMNNKGYLSKMIQIIPKFPASIHRSEVVKGVEAELRSQGRKIPENLEKSIQSAYSQNCEGYSAFKKKLSSTSPLFKSKNKSDGKWSVHPDYKMPSLDDS